MQTADQSKKGPDPTAPPPYPGGGMMAQGQTGSYAGGFVAPPVGPGYNGAPPPQQGYPPQNPGYPAPGGVSSLVLTSRKSYISLRGVQKSINETVWRKE